MKVLPMSKSSLRERWRERRCYVHVCADTISQSVRFSFILVTNQIFTTFVTYFKVHSHKFLHKTWAKEIAATTHLVNYIPFLRYSEEWWSFSRFFSTFTIINWTTKAWFRGRRSKRKCKNLLRTRATRVRGRWDRTRWRLVYWYALKKFLEIHFITWTLEKFHFYFFESFQAVRILTCIFLNHKL